MPNVPSCHELLWNEAAIYIENLKGNTLIIALFWYCPTGGVDYIGLWSPSAQQNKFKFLCEHALNIHMILFWSLYLQLAI